MPAQGWILEVVESSAQPHMHGKASGLGGSPGLGPVGSVMLAVAFPRRVQHGLLFPISPGGKRYSLCYSEIRSYGNHRGPVYTLRRIEVCVAETFRHNAMCNHGRELFPLRRSRTTVQGSQT
jgi:hypothetical protein